ncbi:MAG TPA: DNRLRE domain-containing protein, partial [Lacunisphaera sp.]|nr:DNRLRE domain-containing protein [Lacunisphaera sp.]
MNLAAFPRALLGAAALVSSVASLSALTVTLHPSADAHVRSGPAFQNRNFGGSWLLESNQSALPSANFDREIYLKFDLSQLTSVRTAKLRLWGVAWVKEIVTTDLYSAPDVSWTENGITWANRPATGPVMWDTVALQDEPAWHEWDVTQFLMGEKAMGRDVVTLVLRNSVASKLDFIWFASGESPVNRPQLVVEEAFPWSYYEAEKGAWDPGATLETGTLWGETAYEARGKQAVTLDDAGEYVE